MRTILLSGGVRIRAVYNEAIYNTPWQKMNDSHTYYEKNAAGRLAVMT